ncbi:MAG: hypothetical protein JWP12_3207 [Bacteroidetes bacterium]|nr:hypothetical protein [Bacteroidota bacterium]
MKNTKITFIVIPAVVMAACSPVKKSATSTASAAPVSTPTPASDDYLFTAKRADGIYTPGDAELTAIQTKYKDATLDKLKEGHAIYTQGACTNCHNAKNIYELDEANWKNILDDMAQRTSISDTQKDAVYKYVLAIKATQPK